MKLPFTLPLNEGQQDGLDKLENWLLDPQAPQIFRLRGRAGTGKSVLVAGLYDSVKVLNQVLATFGMPQCEIKLTATTNQAAEELNSKIKEAEVTTIHSLLCLTVTEFNGESKTVLRKNHQVTDNFSFSLRNGHETAIVIIDEASYMSAVLMDYLEELLIAIPTLRVVLVYDHKQLLPINYDTCYVDEVCDDTNSILHELTQNERFLSGDSSAIAIAADELCLVIGDDNKQISDIEEGADLVYITSEQAIDVCLQHFREPEYKWNAYHCLYVAHTNLNVVDSNRVLHEELEGDMEPLDVLGMHLTLNAPVFNTNAPEIPLARNNQKVTLVNGPRYHSTIHGVRVASLPVMAKPNVPPIVLSVALDSTQLLATMKKAASEKNWTVYYDLKNFVADLRLSYGSTVYKAQGKSCNYVIVDVADILDKSRTLDEAKRLLYVAITRARRKVYLILD